MVPTLTLKIYQEEEQYDREEQIVHLTIHVLTSGKQSGHPGNTPRGIFIWHLARAHFPCRRSMAFG